MNSPVTPPFALDGSVTRDKLAELLQIETELTWLDYKRECDLSDTQALVGLAKDVGAMTIQGGYLVIGADGNGHPIGFPPKHRAPYDQATLAAKFGRYLPGDIDIRSAVHDLDPDGEDAPKAVALIWVGPHPDGWCVFSQNGDFTHRSGAPGLAFRAGEVYARHGTKSELWNQSDIATARATLVARAKDAWRAEHAEETRRALQTALSGAAVIDGPSTAFTWRLDAAGFEAGAVELIRRDDDVPVRRMLRDAAGEVRRLVLAPTGSTDDLGVVLDRIITIAGLGLELRRTNFTMMATSELFGLYGWAISDRSVQTSQHNLGPVLWLRIAERLYALGGLAVRLLDWSTVRALALAPVPALDRDTAGRTWHRDALTQSARALLLYEQPPGGQARQLSLLHFARSVAGNIPALHPDMAGAPPTETGGSDLLLTSICQFDLLLTVVSGAAVDAQDQQSLLSVSFPSYSRFESSVSDGVVAPLVFDVEMRQTLLQGISDERLARILQLASGVARKAGASFWGWGDYTDSAVAGFINLHRP